MPRTKRITQIFLFLMAITSGVMLSMSIESIPLMLVAIIGTTLGFLIADVWGRFHIDGWLANVVSILILVVAMRDFIPSDSAGKLIAVANLLVYLQTVLMFQDKTPRLNWQVMVLSLLQVVITAIFSLGFEGSFLFLIYFVLGGCTMAMQCLYADSLEIKEANEVNAKRLQTHLGIGGSFLSQWATQESRKNRSAKVWAPVAIFDTSGYDSQMITKRLLSLILMFGLSAAFTSVLFFMAPRQSKPWYGPVVKEVRTAGLQKSVELNDTGRISLSDETFFRVAIEDPRTGESLQLSSPIYFRGIALSNLVIKDGMTSWKAPYHRITDETYQALLPVDRDRKLRKIDFVVSMKETSDPLIYGVMPFHSTMGMSRSIQFCHEISAVTRCRENETIELVPFTYRFSTIINNRGTALTSWPYVSNTRFYSQQPMANDPAQHAWLTHLERERYPKLCEIADRLHREVKASGGSRRDFVRELERHFLNPANYSYTLDYREVPRVSGLDPIEDFVANHHQGHCSMFASAMTIMLRSQGIPARYVSGFHGGDFNELTRQYVVRGNHAHAWVEVYLRPEDCDQSMLDSGAAGPGGAWLIAEPTPETSGQDSALGAGDAIELARTVWQDYMLGMEELNNGGDNAYSLPIAQFFENLKMTDVPAAIRLATSNIDPITKAVLSFLIGLLFLIPLTRILIRQADYEEEKPATTVGKLRRFIADAIGLISPELREWVIGSDAATAFYVRFLDLMNKHDLRREPSQTHREFAHEAITKFSEHPSIDEVQSTISLVTEQFNKVRFGRVNLEPDERKEIDQRLDQLTKQLGQA